MSINATKFLEIFFKKLTVNDFKVDRVLGAFYSAYIKQIEQDKDNAITPPNLFEFFTEYIIRNKNIVDGEYDTEIKKIYSNIVHEMLNPTDITNDDNPRLRHDENKQTNNSVLPQLIESKIKYTLSKSHAMSIICEFIKMSFIIIDENPDTESRQEDVDFRDNSTASITEEIIAEFGSLPNAIKSIEFERRNEIIEIWHNCENNCNKFIEKDALAEVLKKVYVIDCSNLTLSTNNLTTFIDDTLTDENLPLDELNSNYANIKYNTIVSVLNTDVLSESISRVRRKNKNLLIISENQFNTGGNSDQGIESNITPLYLSSSYNLSLNRASYAYPLKPNIVIYSPSVLVFKDHTKKKYPMLGPMGGCSITVLASAPIFKPQLNIVIDKYSLDPKLFLPNTKYIDDSIIEKQITCIFNFALFINQPTIVIDDRGVLYSYSPAHHTAQILARVINKFKGKFAEIVVCIADDRLYQIYKSYIQ